MVVGLNHMVLDCRLMGPSRISMERYNILMI